MPVKCITILWQGFRLKDLKLVIVSLAKKGKFRQIWKISDVYFQNIWYEKVLFCPEIIPNTLTHIVNRLTILIIIVRQFLTRRNTTKTLQGRERKSNKGCVWKRCLHPISHQKFVGFRISINSDTAILIIILFYALTLLCVCSSLLFLCLFSSVGLLIFIIFFGESNNLLYVD